MVTGNCSRCGQPVDESTALCPACLLEGALSDETIARDTSCISCSSCGTELVEGARFCSGCGGPATQASQTPDDPLRHSLEEKLGGQYRILRLLGRGGMGAVYLARDLTLEREVAIKVVSAVTAGTNLYDRFRREAKTAARLSHPNVVPLHAFGNIDGLPYFVMGYVRGESLAERLRRDGRLPEDEARRILAEIADALDHAHRQGVVHRDVKPDNVLLEDASGRALLTDFGIAKSMVNAEALTHHGGVVGTPHYMSPEQAAGRAGVDGRSDIYSLGVMAYVMLGGRLPFEGKSAAEIMSKHLTQEAPSLRVFAPAVSEAMEQTIERCLAKDPDKRWQDARALRMSLGTIDEAGLPDALEAVHGHGAAFALIAISLLLLAWKVVVGVQNAPNEVLVIIGGGLLFAYVAVVFGLKREGYPARLSQRVIWTEPSWWLFWYPRPLRRRFNVWDRLPAPVRRFRLVVPLVFIALGVTAFDPGEDFVFTRKLLAFLVVLLLTIALEIAAKRHLRRRGITGGNDLNRIAFAAPLSRATFWNQPRIAAILAPLSAVESRSDGTPAQQLREIIRISGELAGPHRALGLDAVAAARRLVEAIAQADRQIAELTRNADAREVERLEEKIGALRNLDGSAPMRELLEKQLELLRGLAARVEDETMSRSRHIEMLRMLALHMQSLRAGVAKAPSEADSLSQAVRVICEQLVRHGQTSAQESPTAPQSGIG